MFQIDGGIGRDVADPDRRGDAADQPLVAGDILDEKDLPLRFTAWTPVLPPRRAGAAGATRAA